MEYEEIIRKRFSVRKYSEKIVSEDDIQKILEAGVLAPTAKNLQPERILVVRSDDGLKKIDMVTPCRYGALTCLIVCADKSVAFANGAFSSYVMDASIVGTQMMLEAFNLGIDSTWIRMFDDNRVKDLFELGDDIEPVFILNLGYRADDCPISPGHGKRKAISEVVRYM